jgi:Fic family protein
MSRRWIWQLPDWPNFRFEPARVGSALERARLVQGEVLGMARVLGFHGLRSALSDIWVEETRATALIEGERLELEAVRSSVARKLGLQSPSGAVPGNIENLVEIMADAAEGWEKPMTRARLCAWQAALFPTGYTGLKKIEIGRLRRRLEPMQVVSGPLHRQRVHFEAPPAARVAKELDQLLKWLSRATEDGILRAGIAHLWFETIHPFEDGNGRVGRALMDFALAQDARTPLRLYSMSRELQDHRSAYYAALERASRGTLDITDWLIFFCERFEAACRQSAAVIERTLAKARFWIRHAEVNLQDRQRKVVNRLLDAGPGGFEGGLSTKKYQSMTGTSRATAYRDLSELVELGLLAARGDGRATRYEPVVPEWVTTARTGKTAWTGS